MIRLLLASMLLLAGCASKPVSPARQAQAQLIVDSRQDHSTTCTGTCGIQTSLRPSQVAGARAMAPHQIILLDQGQDALLARLHMIESARESIELQVFIYDLDESGTLILDALVRAARRGVKVRLMLDQLYGLTFGTSLVKARN